MKKLFVSVPMKGRTEDEIKASIQKNCDTMPII